ncbi:MAG: phosphoribosylanthranilate isomerase [Anaerolineae bacterium]|nr:phosphoribosylanthranilate isomerase [Anaerolineae bacterium]
MIIQIYGISTAEDGAMVSGMGAEHVGLAAGMRTGMVDEAECERVRDLFAAIVSPSKRLVLTHDADVARLVRLVEVARPDILHIKYNYEGTMGPDKVAELRRLLPGTSLMVSVPVDGPEAVDISRSYDDVADYVMLDSPGQSGHYGATGAIHDWSISRRVVEACSIPVLLAGGLGPDNVAESIRRVHPAGVDSMTHTSYADNRFRKDPARVRRFIEEARAAAAELGL